MKKMILGLIVAVTALAIGLAGWGWYLAGSDNGYEEAKLLIETATGEQVFRVALAETIIEKEQGLSGRERLAADEGMLFIYEKPAQPGFWMRGMKFPIDIIWIQEGRVVGFESRVEPAGFIRGEIRRPREPVTLILEVAAGTAERLGLKGGERVSWWLVKNGKE